MFVYRCGKKILKKLSVKKNCLYSRVLILCYFPPLQRNRGNSARPCAHTASLHGQTARAWRKLERLLREWHVFPFQPFLHSQKKSVTRSRHVPPLWQGLALQSSMSGGDTGRGVRSRDLCVIINEFMNSLMYSFL